MSDIIKVSHMTTCVVNHFYLSDWAQENWIHKAQVSFPGSSCIYSMYINVCCCWKKLALPMTSRGKSEDLLSRTFCILSGWSLPLDDFIYILSKQYVIILNITASVSSVSLSSNDQVWWWSWWHQNFRVRLVWCQSLPKFCSGKSPLFRI